MNKKSNHRNRKAYTSDILRTIRKGRRRFLSLLLITVLGVMMFSGLQASCMDLRYSADEFFDQQKLHDLFVVSTLGLTEEDLEAILTIEGVEAAEPEWSLELDTAIGESSAVLEYRSFNENGMDVPCVEEGTLPSKVTEIAITEKAARDYALSIGDALTIVPDSGDEAADESKTISESGENPDQIEELDKKEDKTEVSSLDDEETDQKEEEGNAEDTDTDEADPSWKPSLDLSQKEFTVTAIVTDTTNINNPFGSVSYRNDSSAADTVFVLPEAFEGNYYTGIRIKVSGADVFMCYTDEYEEQIAAVKDSITDTILESREAARNEEVIGGAQAELDEARADADAELADAYQKLIDGEQELEDGKKEGEEKLKDAQAELDEEIASAARKLEDGQTELDAEIASGTQKLKDGQAELDASIASGTRELEDGQAQLDAEISSGAQQLKTAQTQLDTEIASGTQQLNAAQTQLDTETAAGASQLNAAQAELDAEISAGTEQLNAAQEQLDKEMAAAAAELAGGEKQLQEAAEQLAASRTELNESRSQAEAELDANQAQLEAALAAYEAVPDEIKAEDETWLALIAALQELNQQRSSSEEAFAAAEAELDAADAELEQKNQEAAAAAAALEQQKTAAQAEIDAGWTALYAGQAEGQSQIDAGWEALNSARADGQSQIDAGRSALYAGQAEGQSQIDSGWAELYAGQTEGQTQINSGWTELEAGRAEGQAQIDSGWAELEAGRTEGQAQIDSGWTELEEGRIDGQNQIDAGWTELEEELAEAREELDDGWMEYEKGRIEAEEKLADAQSEIDDLRTAAWYVQERGSLSGYANLESDADSIEAIGTAFPVVFFIVAILISLTTITRMVEEDRSLIGTYKSLGFTDGEIRRKYLIYAGAASISGAVIGTILAFIGLPSFIFIVFDIMYLLPGYSYHFIPVYGLTGPLVFLGGILLASALAVRSELKQVPAALMRPLAPKAGSRILLERIRPLWRSMTFLQKVTARNLFRYKKRLLMTIFGIAGCTALMLFGFAIRDSVQDLSPRQYEETFLFDLMSVADGDESEAMYEYLEESSLAADRIDLEITSADLSNAQGKTTAVTVMITDSKDDLSSYINLENKDTGELYMENGIIYVTRNAANVLGLSAGDTANLKLADLQSAEITITELTENYLGNYVYMTTDTYEEYFEGYQLNASLAHLNGSAEEQIAFTDELKEVDGVLSVTGIAELESQFNGAFMLINMVVAIVLVMSAALAFVVLFTLASTNISERQRELATIKVLGFFDPEVHMYVNRETMILTGIGILAGMPLGRLFAQSLTVILNLPSIYLAVSLKPRSYLYALILDVVFALLVNVVINRTMDRIDPVEALKSVE